MKKIAAILAISATAVLGVAAANTPAVPASPSASLGIDLDVKPAEGKAGQFLVSSVVTDLESGAVIARPALLIGANRPARIETGAEGKWKLEISVTADGAARKAVYDASFTREGRLVSKQRVSVNLGA